MNDVGIKGALLFVGAVMRTMAQQEPLKYSGRYGERSLGKGSIVLIGSTNSLVAAPGMAAYVAAKHAVIGIARSAGKLGLSYGVSCSPGTLAYNMCSCGCFGLKI